MKNWSQSHPTMKPSSLLVTRRRRSLILLLAVALGSVCYALADADDLFVYDGKLVSGSSYRWSGGSCTELGLGLRGVRSNEIPKTPGLFTVAPVPAVGWLRYGANSAVFAGTTGDHNSLISHINHSPVSYKSTGDGLTFWTPAGFRLAQVRQDPKAIGKGYPGAYPLSTLAPPGQVIPLYPVDAGQTSRWPNSGYGLTALVPSDCNGGHTSQTYKLNGIFIITSNNPTVTKVRVRIIGKIDAEYLKTDSDYSGNDGYTNAYLVVKGPEEQFWFGGESASPITVANGLRKPILTVEQPFPAGRTVQGLVAEKTLSLPVGQPINWSISGMVSANARASRAEPRQAIWAAIKEHRLELKILDSAATFTAVPPPVKPLTGGLVRTPTPPVAGTVVLPGRSSPSTTITKAAPTTTTTVKPLNLGVGKVATTPSGPAQLPPQPKAGTAQ